MRSTNTKGVVILLLFLVSTLSSAAPTNSNHETDFLVCALSANSNTSNDYRPDINQIAELYNSHLANNYYIEFQKPLDNFISSQSPPIRVKYLPAVPGTLPMVFVGFLCVSLVKNRRMWLTVLARLLWLSKTGFAALPQIALHLARKKQTIHQPSANVSSLCKPKQPCRPRSELEGTLYIGLLHYLAGIPNRTTSLSLAVPHQSFLTQRALSNLWSRSKSNLKTACNHLSFVQIKNNFRPPKFAVKVLSSCLIHTTNCLAFRAGLPVCLSPVFIVTYIARGPPNRVLEQPVVQGEWIQLRFVDN